MRLQRRLNLGFAALLGLFTAFLVVQFGTGGRLRDDHDRRSARIAAAREANQHALQRMTDAETGVRGYQLTGERLFLEPYENGRGAALAALGTAAEQTRDPQVRELVEAERQAAYDWLAQYAASVIDRQSRATRTDPALGKHLFDRVRALNAAADDAIAAEQHAENAAGRRRSRILGAGSAALVLAVLAAGYLLVRVSRRQLLVPLARLGDTIRRQAAGDRSARAELLGAAELRTVIEALNDLSAQTEELLAAEQARTARAWLCQAVVAELQQEGADPAQVGHRVVARIGGALGADAVHGNLFVPGTGQIAVRWPPEAPDPAPDAVTGIRDMPAGQPAIRAGGLAVTIGGDPDCPGGWVLVVREFLPQFTAPEHRLLASVAGEIERALRQLGIRVHQELLIGQLRMLDQRKDVFIQTVTHELRTPLTSILGYAEMLADEDEELNPMQRRSLNAILRNGHRLQDTINDLLLLDRPATAVDAVTEPLDLAVLATTVHAELQAAAQAKNLAVTLDAAPAWVRGDRTQLQRALRKLLENAIKFTAAGGSVTWGCDADSRHVTVTVTDTGIGIPPEDVSGLFTPFHRAGNAMDQAVQGPGLGLAIVRDIVRDHGGAIAVQSVVGRGTTFTVTLPAVPAPVALPVS
ncbi:histidine kinase [Actinoplanes sp. SE50]|uniref:ATP-binding protein n=1 Tax=unclassified Actinoplanes TaxID=2626549 RepID=UPI00023ED221|nr:MULTISPECIES: ATP-binding protein [unclassified Actinoplanes]AEV83890.1 multi-sensor signal transduction histidine kinase [Actinoplanes sp. SE50/110]ATO81966.1 histidine kinase [Actinoplanes sp. SE50]SLL99374.1 histidine kinase [Actinoplanes sp. SE50/110]